MSGRIDVFPRDCPVEEKTAYVLGKKRITAQFRVYKNGLYDAECSENQARTRSMVFFGIQIHDVLYDIESILTFYSKLTPDFEVFSNSSDLPDRITIQLREYDEDGEYDYDNETIKTSLMNVGDQIAILSSFFKGKYTVEYRS